MGLVYGVCLAVSFLWVERTGSLSLPNAAGLALITVVVAALGAACSAMLSWFTYRIRALRQTEAHRSMR